MKGFAGMQRTVPGSRATVSLNRYDIASSSELLGCRRAPGSQGEGCRSSPELHVTEFLSVDNFDSK